MLLVKMPDCIVMKTHFEEMVDSGAFPYDGLLLLVKQKYMYISSENAVFYAVIQ